MLHLRVRSEGRAPGVMPGALASGLSLPRLRADRKALVVRFVSVSVALVGTDVHLPNGSEGLLTAVASYVNVLKERPKKRWLVARTLAPRPISKQNTECVLLCPPSS